MDRRSARTLQLRCLPVQALQLVCCLSQPSVAAAKPLFLLYQVAWQTRQRAALPLRLRRGESSTDARRKGEALLTCAHPAEPHRAGTRLCIGRLQYSDRGGVEAHARRRRAASSSCQKCRTCLCTRLRAHQVSLCVAAAAAEVARASAPCF